MEAAGDICNVLLPWCSLLNHWEDHLAALISSFRENIVKGRPTAPHKVSKRLQKIQTCLNDTLLLLRLFGGSKWQTLWCTNHFPSRVKQKTWSIKRKHVFTVDSGFRSPQNHSCYLPWRPIDLCRLLFPWRPGFVILRKTILFPIGFILFCTSKRTFLCWYHEYVPTEFQPALSKGYRFIFSYMCLPERFMLLNIDITWKVMPKACHFFPS